MKEKKETLSEKCNRQTQVISKQQQSIEALQQQDGSTRRQFTNVLMGRPDVSYFSATRSDILSWEEIFFKVGSLSAQLFNSDMQHEIESLRDTVSKITEPTTTPR